MAVYVMHLVHSVADGQWHLKHLGSSIATFATKIEAERAGQVRGNTKYANGEDAQLVVHREDGSIEYEYAYTYGYEPRQHPD